MQVNNEFYLVSKVKSGGFLFNLNNDYSNSF